MVASWSSIFDCSLLMLSSFWLIVGFASEIRRETGLTTMAVGQITEPFQAEAIIRTGQADMVSMARGMLADPRWAWHAAEALGEQASYAPQYMRSSKSLRGLPIPGNPPVAK